MIRVLKVLAIVALVVVLPACKGSSERVDGPLANDLTGTWTGKFSNGINITVPLVQTGTALTGTFDTGDTQGTVSGEYTASSFTLQLTKTSSSGTQRSLTNVALSSDKKRITADWNDGGGGQSGTFCLAAPASTPCETPIPPLTGTWTGKFSNGINITVPLVQSGTSITGTFDTGDTQGTVAGTITASTFTFQLTKTSSSGTQRSLTAPAINTARNRITANWNDGGGGQSGTFCLAAPSSTVCP